MCVPVRGTQLCDAVNSNDWRVTMKCDDADVCAEVLINKCDSFWSLDCKRVSLDGTKLYRAYTKL